MVPYDFSCLNMDFSREEKKSPKFWRNINALNLSKVQNILIYVYLDFYYFFVTTIANSALLTYGLMWHLALSLLWLSVFSVNVYSCPAAFVNSWRNGFRNIYVHVHNRVCLENQLCKKIRIATTKLKF